MPKRRLSFPTRSDQCKAGPGDVNRTAAQQSTKRGLDKIRSIPPRTRSMPRFQAGSRNAERLKVVVTIDETVVGTQVETIAVSARKTQPLHPEEGNVSEKWVVRIRGLRSRSPRLWRRARSLDHAL